MLYTLTSNKIMNLILSSKQNQHTHALSLVAFVEQDILF